MVSLWGDWAEAADYVEPGLSLAVFDADEREYRGKTQYSTGRGTMVVVEPDYLVDVTDVRGWVQCPRLYYLNKLGGTPLAEPVVTGTVVHEVFGDLLRGRGVDEAVEDRVDEAGLDTGLLGADRESVAATVRQHAAAIDAWLHQGTLTERDEWRSELTLLSERYGLKGRADAVRRGTPVELKTGKNTNREPRFQDKVHGCYALLLGERSGEPPDAGTLLYTKNATVDRVEAGGTRSSGLSGRPLSPITTPRIGRSSGPSARRTARSSTARLVPARRTSSRRSSAHWSTGASASLCRRSRTAPSTTHLRPSRPRASPIPPRWH